jgi:hypothetical protein
MTPNGSDSAEGSFAADRHAAWQSWVLRASEFARSHWNREMLEQMRRADRQAWSTIEHLAGPLSWRNGNAQPPRKTVVRAN